MNPTRRDFLATSTTTATLGAAPPAEQPLLRPKALKPGDTVGLITPATYVCDPDRLELAKRTVQYLGLKYKVGKNVGKRAGYLGGSIQDRVDDLHAMFSDPEVKAVFCVRGGYGSAMLLDKIDFQLIRKNPKIFTGYSDITALHLGMQHSAGLVSLHGPTALSRFSDYTLENFKRAVFEPQPLGKLQNPPERNTLRPAHMIRTLRGGKARGPLIGGNLTLISTTLGTPWEIDTAGRILFLEDVEEQPYSMDRMLTQLRLAGKFDQIQGLVIGECAGCVPREFKPSFECTFSLGEVLDHILGDLKVPVFSGLTIGHTEDQLTLPLGVMATIDADEGTLTLEESALSD
jgi:muramoyltetrapeptide carboxypeptidase